MVERLVNEIIDTELKKSQTFKQKIMILDIAEKNKAFSNFF